MVATQNTILKASRNEVAKVGPNFKKLEGWRERLNVAVGDMSLREVANKAVLNGHAMAHTTVRSILLGHGGVQVQTIAAVCDAIGADLVKILSGSESLVSVSVPGGSRVLLPSGAIALPIIRVQHADNWRRYYDDPPEDIEYQIVAIDDDEITDDTLAIRVTDDSMAPTFSAGDTVFIRKEEPKRGKSIVVAQIAEAPPVLRLYSESAKSVKLTALNEEYGETTASPNRVQIFGVVVRHIRKL